jgi:phosphonate transport system substrate-binding protein
MAVLLCSLTTRVTAEEEHDVLRFGVLSIAQPSRIHLKWQPFVDYVSREMGQPIEIVIPRGFNKMKRAAASGAVDVFYINSHVFYRLQEAGVAVPLAQMKNINGKVTSRSDIFVRADSSLENVRQLKDHSIAFVSPMGAGGYLAPRALLYQQGIASGKETREVFTRNLSTSIHKVLLGEVDAASMCGVNFRLMTTKLDSGELKIIGRSDEYQENVLAASSRLDKALRQRFQQVVLAMPGEQEGRRVLQNMHDMKISEFVAYDKKLEDITRKLLEQGRL